MFTSQLYLDCFSFYLFILVWDIIFIATYCQKISVLSMCQGNMPIVKSWHGSHKNSMEIVSSYLSFKSYP